MDMDPVTRREAEKIEEVLHDLVADLELVSYLPEEFTLWLRDDLQSASERFDTQQLPLLVRAGGVGAAAPPPLFGQQETREELLEELQRRCKASSFLHAAECYGDPADTAGNEALLQLSEFNEVERELLDAATSAGHVNDDDLDFYRLSLRALLDTLRGGDYATHVQAQLHSLCPPPSPASSVVSDEAELSSTSSQSLGASASGARVAADGAASEHRAPFDKASALEAGLLAAPVSGFADTARALAQLIRRRNGTTVNEDVQRYKVLFEAVNKEQSAAADVQALNRAYSAVKAARRREVAALDQQIAQLQEELAYAQRTADVELEAMNEVSAKVLAERAVTYQLELEQHRESAAALAERVQQVEREHAAEAAALRSVRTKKEAAVSGAIHEYDAQASSMASAIAKLRAAAEADTSVVVALEANVALLRGEQRQHEWELQAAEQRHSHQAELRQRQAQGARLVQAYFRAYAARTAAERDMSAKDKKKGTKKKKKGAA